MGGDAILSIANVFLFYGIAQRTFDFRKHGVAGFYFDKQHFINCSCRKSREGNEIHRFSNKSNLRRIRRKVGKKSGKLFRKLPVQYGSRSLNGIFTSNSNFLCEVFARGKTPYFRSKEESNNRVDNLYDTYNNALIVDNHITYLSDTIVLLLK